MLGVFFAMAGRFAQGSASQGGGPNHQNFHSNPKILDLHFPTFPKGMMGVLLFHVVKRVFLLFHLKLAEKKL